MKLSGANIVNLQVQCLVFTKSGSELANLIEFNPNSEYLNLIANFFRQHGIEVKRGAVVKKDDVTITSFDEEF